MLFRESSCVCDIGSEPRIPECPRRPEWGARIQYPGAQVAVAIETSGEGPGIIRTQPRDSSGHHMKPPFTAKDTFQDSTNTHTHTHTTRNMHSLEFAIHTSASVPIMNKYSLNMSIVSLSLCLDWNPRLVAPDLFNVWIWKTLCSCVPSIVCSSSSKTWSSSRPTNTATCTEKTNTSRLRSSGGAGSHLKVCVCVCIWERERETVCVCVCRFLLCLYLFLSSFIVSLCQYTTGLKMRCFAGWRTLWSCRSMRETLKTSRSMETHSPGENGRRERSYQPKRILSVSCCQTKSLCCQEPQQHGEQALSVTSLQDRC